VSSLPRDPQARGSVVVPALLLALALACRLLAIRALPVVFDETCVMAYGLLRARGGVRAFLFEAPVAVSNGITPLWFWLQGAPVALLGETTKAGLRTLPLLLGLLAVWLSYRENGALSGRRAAAIGGFLAAIHGPYLFANARGEYSESLLVVLVLLLFHDLATADGALPRWRSAVWPATALLTYLGKGLVVWAAFALYVASLAALRAVGRRPASAGRAAALVVLPLLPALAWLLAAQVALFGGGATLATDLGTVGSVFTNVRRLTTGYGSEAQPFMVAGPREALFVYGAFAVWPTLALLVAPGLAGLARLGADLVRAVSLRDLAAAAAALRPLCLVLLPLAVLVGKGALDVRFHLLYGPVLLLVAAVTIDRWLHVRPLVWLPGGALAWVYVASTQAGVGSGLRLGWVVAGLLTAALLGLAPPGRRGLALLPLAAYALAASLFAGPLDWGRRWAWEPGPIAADLPRAVDSFPNPDLQLVHCAEGRDGRPPARALLLRALERHPGDRETVMSVAETLLEGDPADARLVLPSLSELSRRHPEDGEAGRLLERVVATTGGRP
jgi:hypothetical protein